MLILVIITYVFIVPLAVFIHEMGHALAIILFTNKSYANLFIGRPTAKNSYLISLGRIHYHLRWASFGFCYPSNEKRGKSLEPFSIPQRVAIDAGGPVLSLTFGMVGIVTSSLLTGNWQLLMRAFAFLNLVFFLSTALPYIYPSWSKLAGIPTDGYRVKELMKQRTKNLKG
jgi:Zn-dependent protease